VEAAVTSWASACGENFSSMPLGMHAHGDLGR
jgi:hypothetical protein